MKHTYQITGMTCANCEAKVKSAFLSLPDIESAEVSKATGTATITMAKHIALSELQKAIGEKGNYKITAEHHSETACRAEYRDWETPGNCICDCKARVRQRGMEFRV